MSEVPEKKVLRELLLELKTKTLRSEERFLKSQADVYGKISELWKTLTEMLEKNQIEKDVVSLLGFILRELHSLIDMSSTCSTVTLEDFKLYVGALERYSSELDKELTGIFEQAKKIAEEQRKKQEELMKRKPPETYRV